MVIEKVIIELLLIVLIDAIAVPDKINNNIDIQSKVDEDIVKVDDYKLGDVFNGVYTDCFLHLSYSCLQKKTLLYLKELNKLSEVSVIGDYVKFVKLNVTDPEIPSHEDILEDNNSEELSFMIDQAVDKFFDNHIMKFSALGRNISVPNSVEGFVGRKKRKGGGGGGGGGGHMGGFGHDDGGKKKMMMMAMMCMKMKLMMMVPAMMGMMGMMSFKGMMFSMMSFMISKMMLLMKILEKKGLGGGGGGGGGGGDGGWAAGGGGGGAWMPAGGQDYGGGGGGGYDANGQWQSRSIFEKKDMKDKIEKEPIISYVIPTIRYNHKDVIAKDFKDNKAKSRKKRGIIDALQNVYLYWMNQILGGNRRKSNNQRYKIVNGVKYVFYPNKVAHKFKMLQVTNPPKIVDEFKPIIIAEDFNKGETVEGGIESRMNNKKFHKMKDTVNDTFDENPWE